MHRPQRYNAKARSAHKKGKAKKTRSEGPALAKDHVDTNADILEHKAEEDRERERRERMKREVRRMILCSVDLELNMCGSLYM